MWVLLFVLLLLIEAMQKIDKYKENWSLNQFSDVPKKSL